MLLLLMNEAIILVATYYLAQIRPKRSFCFANKTPIIFLICAQQWYVYNKVNWIRIIILSPNFITKIKENTASVNNLWSTWNRQLFRRCNKSYVSLQELTLKHRDYHMPHLAAFWNLFSTTDRKRHRVWSMTLEGLLPLECILMSISIPRDHIHRENLRTRWLKISFGMYYVIKHLQKHPAVKKYKCRWHAKLDFSEKCISSTINFEESESVIVLKNWAFYLRTWCLILPVIKKNYMIFFIICITPEKPNSMLSVVNFMH